MSARRNLWIQTSLFARPDGNSVGFQFNDIAATDKESAGIVDLLAE